MTPQVSRGDNARGYWQLPPPRNPMVEFAQNVSEPPLLVKVQHWS
jgi:hypothetical protein